MTTRSHWLYGMAAVALLTGFATAAEETSPLESAALLTPQEEISAELSAGMRDSLNSVAPEIRLPAIDLQTPAPVAIGG